MRGEPRRYVLGLFVLIMLFAIAVTPAPAAPITITVPYSATAVADADLDGNPATGSWGDAGSFLVPLETGAASPYGAADLYVKHDGTYVYWRVDGSVDVPWTSAAGNHFWFGFLFSTSANGHHQGGQDGVFFGDDTYTTAAPLVAVDTNGGAKPPARDGVQDSLGEMRVTGSAAPYSFTAEWKRKLVTGDANDNAWTADGTTAYYFYASMDSNGGGSSGGSIGHRGTTNDNVMRFAAPPAVDTTPPTVSLTAPPADAYIRGSVTVTATATDNVGVASVTFLLDSTSLGVDSVAPYEVTWDTTSATDGGHTLTAEARDAAGNVASDAAPVTVDNTPPLAVAGSDRVVPPGTIVTFDGSGSSDNLGLASYTWTFTDGGPQTLTGPSPSYTFSNAGSFLVTLRVEDLAANSGTDGVWVNVSADVAPPVARAGPDQGVLQGTLVTLDGSGSTDDVAIDNYTWSFDDGGPIALYGAIVVHRFPNVADIPVTLTVRDFAAKTSSDTMWVNVSADAVPPVPDAGPGQTVDFGASASLDGSGSTDNVGIANYTWTFVDGTAVTLWGPVVTHRFGSVGNVSVDLTVSDYAGNQATGTTWVEVVADSVSPTANAGPDRTVALGDTVTLDGTASSDNVGIVNYTWRVLGTSDVLYGSIVMYGPSAGGDWVFELTVLDAAGNTGVDTVVVTVVAPDTVAPATPTGLSAAASGPGSVTLTWTANSEPDLAGYLIYRLNPGGIPVQLNAEPWASTTYVDAGLEPAQTYAYVIVAVDDSGNASGPTAQVTSAAGAALAEPITWESIRWILLPGLAAFVLVLLAVLAWREERRRTSSSPSEPKAPPPSEGSKP